MAKTSKGKSKRSLSEPIEAQENLRKLFLAGLELADETNEKLQEVFDTLAKRGPIKHPRVKKAVRDIRKSVLTRKKVLEKKFSEYFGQKGSLKSKKKPQSPKEKLPLLVA